MMRSTLTFGSVCSGIEAASVAWAPLGWRAVWFAEVDKAASAVLAYRFPSTPNHGDMTSLAAKVRRREIPAPDVLVGGTPCQSYSVAGCRGGLEDARGQLTIAFIDLADAIDEVRREDGLDPCVIIWENVPGVLTIADNAFGCFLAGLAGDDEALEPGPRPEAGRSGLTWTWSKKLSRHSPKWPNAGAARGPERAVAWRTLDAQFFRLAQRRRRVFVVASARPGFDPVAVLFEWDGLRRDSPPSREAREDLTHAVAPCLTGSGRGVERAGDPRGQDPVVGVLSSAGDAANCGGPARLTYGGGRCGSEVEVAACLVARGQKLDFEVETFVVEPICCVHGTQDPCVSDHTAFALQCNSGQENVIAFDPRGSDIVVHGIERVGALDTKFPGPAIAFSSKDYGGDACDDLSPCLRAGGHTGSHANAGVPPAVVYQVQGCGTNIAVGHGITATLTSNCDRASGGAPCVAYDGPICVTDSTLKDGFDGSEDGTGREQPIAAELYSIMPMNSGKDFKARAVEVAQPVMAGGPVGGNQGGDYVLEPTMAVRRLMPVECERLQGFPDGWTRIPIRTYAQPKITASRPPDMWEQIDGTWWLMTADGPRYKQIGNSMATFVMRWIGERVDAQLSRDWAWGLLG
jgi:DNA (cytosine-5)-methyltransferase 1